VLHLANQHGVAKMQIGRRGIESHLHDEWTAEGESCAQIVQPDDVHAPLHESRHLLVDGSGHERHYTATGIAGSGQLTAGSWEPSRVS